MTTSLNCNILKEYVLLDRFELEQCRVRIGMVDDSLKKPSNLPQVVMATHRGTCFVWIAVPSDYFAQRQILLPNMIYLAKYVRQTERCVGRAYAVRPDGLIELEMGYLETPWAHDPLAEQHLAEHNPFLPFGIEENRDIASTELPSGSIDECSLLLQPARTGTVNGGDADDPADLLRASGSSPS